MQYEKEMLVSLLEEVGINHKLDNRITPSKHPYMRTLEKALKRHKVNYMYFPQTDSLAVTQVDEGVNSSLCHTLMMPSKAGINILMVLSNNNDLEGLMEQMTQSLDKIIPDHISYSILGIV